MNKKKEVPTLLLKAVYEGAELSEQLHQLRTQQRVFDECGLDKEANRMNYHIGKLIKQIDDKVKETQAQRRQLIREMLLAFAAGDIATACADHLTVSCISSAQSSSDLLSARMPRAANR